MGLSISLNKEDTFMYCDFKDAYFVIEEMTIIDDQVVGWLRGYPSRESYKVEGKSIPSSKNIPFGGSYWDPYKPVLWQWEFCYSVEEVFGESIPLKAYDQKRMVYNKIKSDFSYLPFKDVLEEDNEDS